MLICSDAPHHAKVHNVQCNSDATAHAKLIVHVSCWGVCVCVFWSLVVDCLLCVCGLWIVCCLFVGVCACLSVCVCVCVCSVCCAISNAVFHFFTKIFTN